MKLVFCKNILTVKSNAGEEQSFAFPAVTLSLSGRRIKARTLLETEKLKGGGFRARYKDGGLVFDIRVTPGRHNCFFKEVEITGDPSLPTPDYVEIDAQTMAVPGLKKCGYMITDGRKVSPKAEEEGAGVTPGCGYPLVGERFFTGLEHPAAFNEIVSEKAGSVSWHLRHHPVWEDGRIICVRQVTCLDPEPRARFMEYLNEIRLPVLKNFLVSFCSFWSDPYLGNFEYKVDSGNYTSLVNAFSRQGLCPDVYTLDAGWQNRKSFFSAKEDFGGDEALKKLAACFRSHGSRLALWVSHNGPMGIDPDFLRSQGIAVGSGKSSTYSGEGYGVMMDKKFEEILTRRWCELASGDFGAVHFKMDWENDSATNPDFAEKYPTRDHVREASVNMMSRVADAMRKAAPGVMTRNGWWPSPWWLTRTNHTFLTDSGDSEYASFPALTQRDAAATHRDLMYYAHLRRDGSVYPLDAFDNHEFPHALRNPFCEQPDSWSNTCLWSIMRGASYLPMTLQPEALENWQAKILRDTLSAARKYASRILTGKSCMIGGNPSCGEIYGFCHPDKKGRVMLGLRNASPVPQSYTLPADKAFWCQLYPVCRNFKAGETIVFAPHEVKIFDGRDEALALPAPECRIEGRKVYLPASKHPGVAEIYQIPELKHLEVEYKQEKNSLALLFGIRVPYKMRNFRLSVKLGGEARNRVTGVELLSSRYRAWLQSCCWQVPCTELKVNRPGGGEWKNPDLQARPEARYFTAELPQGGESFYNLIFTGAAVDPRDIELYLSGFEAPAETAEPELFGPAKGFVHLPAHPEGFPRVLKIELP